MYGSVIQPDVGAPDHHFVGFPGFYPSAVPLPLHPCCLTQYWQDESQEYHSSHASAVRTQSKRAKRKVFGRGTNVVATVALFPLALKHAMQQYLFPRAQFLKQVSVAGDQQEHYTTPCNPAVLQIELVMELGSRRQEARRVQNARD